MQLSACDEELAGMEDMLGRFQARLLWPRSMQMQDTTHRPVLPLRQLLGATEGA